MDSDAQERIIRFLGSIAFAGMLMIFAFLVKESLPYVTAALGVVVGNVTGAEIATRTAKQTRKKIETESERPPPPDDDGSGTTVVQVSDAPPPRYPRNDRVDRDRGRGGRNFFVAFLATLAALAALACAKPDPLPALYGAERVRCVEENDAAAPARECMRAVDARYGRDGGLSR